MTAKWEDRFTSEMVGLDKHQLTDLVNYCYTKANSQSGLNYTDGVERDIWKAKAKMAINKRNSL